MTTKEFLKHSEKVIETVNSQKDLIKFLDEIASFNSDYIELYKKLRGCYTNSNTRTYENMSKVIIEIDGKNKQVLARIRFKKPFDLYTQLQLLINGLSEIQIFGDEIDVFLKNDVRILIDSHTEAYSERNFNHIFSFVSFCIPFVTKLNRFFHSAQVFTNNINILESDMPKENDVIDIQVVNSSFSLEDFTSFLSIIDKLYHETCASLNFHYSDYPLNIIKIESGSIWTKLFGQKHVIKLIKELIFGLGSYIRDLQTGNIDKEKFANKIEKAGLVLDLIEKAKKIGLKSDKQILLEKAFNQTIVSISKSLPSSTTEIFLDDNPLLKLDKVDIKAIEGKKILMLKGNNQNDNTQPSA